ncbi:MAG: universal stress protein [Actinomycetota bacterium]
MFSRILYPTDFSAVSKKAADYIHQLRDAGAAEVIVLHVIDTASLMAPTTPGVLGGIGATPALNQRAIDDWRAAAATECDQLADALTEAGFFARTIIDIGDPADVILRAAEEEGADVVVIGATGKGHIAELILGSVSDTVIRKSHLPLLVIKP